MCMCIACAFGRTSKLGLGFNLTTAPSVDEQLMGWVQTQKWRKRDFEANEEGTVFLRQQLARIVVQKSWIADAKV